MALPPPTRSLVCPTRTRVNPELLATAIAQVATGNCYVHVIVPAVLPSTMPISAYPPRLGERLEQLRIAAVRAVREPMRRGRVEILPCRSVQSAISQAFVRGTPDEIVLVGPASWRLRRSLRHLAPYRVVSQAPAPQAAPATLPRTTAPARAARHASAPPAA
jgi:hypothetical protein